MKRLLPVLLALLAFPASAAITSVGSGAPTEGVNVDYDGTIHASSASADLMFQTFFCEPFTTGAIVDVDAGSYSQVEDSAGSGSRQTYAKIHDGTEDSTPLMNVTPETGILCISLNATFRGVLQDTIANAIDGTVESTTNTSQTEVNYSALTVNGNNRLVVLAMGRFGDLCTWPASEDGFTLATSFDTPTNSDASGAIYYQIQTTGTNITAGSIQPTGCGESQNNFSTIVAFEPAASCVGAPVITDVASDESFPATQTNVVITGTNFCSSGTVTLRQNGNSKTLSQDSYADTSIQVDISGAGMGVVSGLLYGAADIRVSNEAVEVDDQAITLEAPSGSDFVELATPVTLDFDTVGNENRVHGGTAALDPTAASQCAWRNLSGLSAVEITSDGSVEATGEGTFDWDCTDSTGSGGSELYVASYGSHPNCNAGSTIVCSKTVSGTPPLYGATPVSDHVLAVGLAMTAYDVDDYFVAGEAASSARALRQLGATTDTTADLSGAHTDQGELTVTNSVAHASLVKGTWMRIGASGVPVRIKYVDPVNNLIGVWGVGTGANADAIITYATGAGSVSQVTVNSGTGAVSGTPDTDATTASLLYRWTDADGLIAESALPFEIDVVTVPDVLADAEAAATATLEALGLGVVIAEECTGAEALGEVLSQQSLSELFGTNVQLGIEGLCSPAAEAKVIYELASDSGLARWVDYIPVAIVADCVPGRYDDDGCWNVDAISSTTGLTPWVDYIPVFEIVAPQASGKWRYENNGWIPVNTLTP